MIWFLEAIREWLRGGGGFYEEYDQPEAVASVGDEAPPQSTVVSSGPVNVLNPAAIKISQYKGAKPKSKGPVTAAKVGGIGTASKIGGFGSHSATLRVHLKYPKGAVLWEQEEDGFEDGKFDVESTSWQKAMDTFAELHGSYVPGSKGTTAWLHVWPEGIGPSSLWNPVSGSTAEQLHKLGVKPLFSQKVTLETSPSLETVVNVPVPASGYYFVALTHYKDAGAFFGTSGSVVWTSIDGDSSNDAILANMYNALDTYLDGDFSAHGSWYALGQAYAAARKLVYVSSGVVDVTLPNSFCSLRVGYPREIDTEGGDFINWVGKKVKSGLESIWPW